MRYVLRNIRIWTIQESPCAFLGIPILLRIIGIFKTCSTVLELSVRVLGIGTIWEFLKCAVIFGIFNRQIFFEYRSKLSSSVSFKKTTKISPGSAAIKDRIPPLKLSGRVEKHGCVKCRQICR